MNPTPETNQNFVAVGSGMSPTAAKNKAMSEINARLWTQVESIGKEQTTHTESNGKEFFRSLSDNKINVETAPVVLVGMAYPKTIHINGMYYVEAHIDRSNIKKQLENELNTLNQDIQSALISQKHTDPLVWWLNNRDVSTLKTTYFSRQAMLMAVSNNTIATSAVKDNLVQLERAVEKTQSTLSFYISAAAKDKNLKGFIGDKLSQEHIATVGRPQKATHQLMVKSDWRQSRVGDAYISTVITRLTVKNSKGQSIASSEVIASGNSVSNYAMSKEGASRHFSAQLSDQGIWHSLGVL